MTLRRSGPLKRTGGLKRGKPLARSGGLKRSRTPIPTYSEDREDHRDERRALVARVIAAHPKCQAQIAGLCTDWSTEVNELMRRSAWKEGYLVEWNTEALCDQCHAHVTANPGRRGWAMRHGHQVSRDAERTPISEEYTIAIAARFLGYACPPDCKIDHRKAPA